MNWRLILIKDMYVGFFFLLIKIWGEFFFIFIVCVNMILYMGYLFKCFCNMLMEGGEKKLKIFIES